MSQLYKAKKIDKDPILGKPALVVKRAGNTEEIILQQDGGFINSGQSELFEVGYFWRALRQKARDGVLASYPNAK